MVKEETIDLAQAFEAKLLSRNEAMHEATARGDSPVQQFYNGTTVFMTGGSGFLGKQLIEKLLRATNILRIYVLLRAKKGKAMQERMDEMLKDSVYDLVRERQPDFAKRIVPVAGDVGELRLGLSDKDWNTITEEVDIFFHMAATTRFDDVLKVVTIINIRGTREAILLGQDCKKLKSYVHVSTAYSHACKSLIEKEIVEDFYKSPVEPETLIKLIETVDEERIIDMTPSLIDNWPNTYSFSKAAAEELVNNMKGDLPLCVIRPAIVVCAHKEPNPGWVDVSNVYGASGLVFGTGLGAMHALYADKNVSTGMIPVDYVNNSIITSAWETARRRAAGETDTKIYTVTTSTRNPETIGHIRHTLENEARNTVSTPLAVGYGFAFITKNQAEFWLLSWLLHFIPVYALDGIWAILGKQRRFVKLYTKMYKMSVALSYFICNSWHFIDNNTATLYDSLTPNDQQIFDFDVKKIDWVEFVCLWCMGLRKYVLKDGLTNTAYGVKKQKILGILMYIITPIYFYSLYKLLSFGVFVLSLMFKLFW